MLTPLQHFLNDTIETVRMLGGMATIPPIPKR
jgi:flagellar biosynthetic protein FliR